MQPQRQNTATTAFGEHHPWLGDIARYCTKNAFFVVAVSQVLTVLCLPLAAFFIPNSSTNADPIHTADSWKARNTMKRLFPSYADSTEFVAIVALKGSTVDELTDNDDLDADASLLSMFSEVEDNPCSYGDLACQRKKMWQHGTWPPLLDDVKKALFQTQATIERHRNRVDASSAPILKLPGLVNFSFALEKSINSHKHIEAFVSNATIWHGQGIPAPHTVVSPSGTATKFTWTLKEKPFESEAIKAGGEYKDAFENKVKQYLPEGKIKYGLFSAPNVAETALLDSERSFVIMDLTSMPMAMAVFVYVLRSWRLLIVPMLCMGTSVIVSFALMDVVAMCVQVQITTSSLMMNIAMAMSIDYSLFMLTRFRTEMENSEIDDIHDRVQACAIIATETAGFAVFMSGSTLFCSFCVLSFVPFPTICTLGWGCSILLILLVSTNLTVGPAVLMHKAEMVAAGIPRKTKEEQKTEDFITRFWRNAVTLQSNRFVGIVTVIVVSALTLMAGWPWYQTKLQSEVAPLVPINTDVHKASVLLRKEFGAGQMSPHQIVMTLQHDQPGGDDTVVSQGAWEDSQRFLQMIPTHLPYTNGILIEGPSYSMYEDGTEEVIPWSSVEDCAAEMKAEGDGASAECTAISRSMGTYISEDRQGLWSSVSLSIDPASHDGLKFTRRLRDLMEKTEKTTQLRFQAAGLGPEAVDNVDKVLDFFPLIVIATLGMAFGLYGYFFRSIAIPLRSVTSILLTLVWCLGLEVRVYQQGVLKWLSWAQLRPRSDGLAFVIPPCCFSIVTGLCLDYDIFLISRVTELRAEGMTTRKAIIEGVVSTGGIITAAGTVMAMTFFGMVICTTNVTLNALGFFMFTAVLYDTFVIRTTVVPATMFMLDRFEWWPSHLSHKNAADEGGPEPAASAS